MGGGIDIVERLRYPFVTMLADGQVYIAADKGRAEMNEAADEIERLRADKDVQRSQERNAAYEKDIAALHDEIDRLRACLRTTTHDMRAEIERLRAERKNCPPVSESEYVKRLEAELRDLEIWRRKWRR